MTPAPRATRFHPIVKLAFAVLAVAPIAAIAGLPPELAKAAKEYDRATVHGDVRLLAQLFADDYMLVNSDASVEDKPQAIADFLLPGFRIDPYVMEHATERAWSDGAVISGVVNLSWTQDGKHHARRLRIAHVWARRDGRWQMTYTQVTRVPQ